MAVTAIPAPAAPTFGQRLPGLALATAIALLALGLGRLAPLIGGPVFGIVMGIAVRNLLAPGGQFTPGIQFAGKQVLQWSIIALGFGLSLNQVAKTGLESLAVTLVTMTVAFLAAWGLGRMLKVHDKLKILIGVGTAICGGSAIAAVTPIIKPDEHDTAFAISTIFLFNLVAVLLFPLLGHLLHLSDLGFGLWAGTAINDTSSVVAAGYSFSKAAGDYATIVKLTRATLIIPICLVLAFAVAWREKKQGASDFSLRRIFPWFILWFLVASAVRTAGLVPEVIQPAIHMAAEFLIIVALTAIGLSANLRKMAATGARPILLGLGVWAAVSVSSLLVQLVIGQL
ncbi:MULTISPECIES: YeiH family protein [Dyella]|uniref:Sulfate exporter family transporter n=2 Tax=Dyella TaxID=231454 RepID=A0ABY1YSD1_9GAMM|nr:MULTISPECIES: putative sulfate exporter family transporter [Dyella]TBR37122.1 putative sulfate exporter family transporter [Dyella terrae]TCI07788.1 putative sulfate exporter family transporter [Dyella soli]